MRLSWWLVFAAVGSAGPACVPARPAAGQTGAAAAAGWAPQARGRVQVGQTFYARLFLVQLLNEPAAGASVVGTVNRNDELVVTEVADARWLRVAYTNGDVGMQGYVRRDQLSPRPVPLPPEPEHP